MIIKHLNLDIYLKFILQFDLFDKNLKIKKFLKYIIFQFNFLKLNLDFSNYLYSKVQFMMRSFTYNLKYKITNYFILTKKKNKIKGFLFKLVFQNFFDICICLDYLRFIFSRFLFINKQIFGLGMQLKAKYIFVKKIKKSFIFFKLYQNDLLFRINSLMDSLLNRENFIYFYDNVDIFYNFIFGCFSSKKKIKLVFTFLGFFILSYKNFIKKYKNFTFYTLIM